MFQMSLFDKPIRLIELFAGIGSQAKALKNIGADFEHYRICEYDKYAVKSYNAVHGTSFQTSDITKISAEELKIVETDKYCYITTYSFPCQDLSTAGKQRGMDKGGNTRSGLLWEVERLLDECTELPQVLLMENVPNVHGCKNAKNFYKWIDKLEKLGYCNYWKDLNAKNYGIPQNRKRCFMVSLLGDYSFSFPKGKPLSLKFKDMLETKVDEHYYLSEEQAEKIINSNFTQRRTSIVSMEAELMRTLTAHDAKEPPYVELSELVDEVLPTRDGRMNEDKQTIVVGMLSDEKYIKMHEQSRRVYDPEGIAPTIHTCGGGNLEPKIIEPNAREDDDVETLTTDVSSSTHNTRIRKITPKECWRLMGFTDEDFDKAKWYSKEYSEEFLNKHPKNKGKRKMSHDGRIERMSNSQLYKQAGNSIVVPVLEAIFRELIGKKGE